VLCTTPSFVVGKGSPGIAFRYRSFEKAFGVITRRITSSL